jgi:hypothetical protein
LPFHHSKLHLAILQSSPPSTAESMHSVNTTFDSP